MTVPAGAPAPALAPGEAGPVWHTVLGLQQEGKAAAAVAALQQMMIVKARVRRDGQLREIPAGQLVPGDIVSIEAGDILPADGRLLRGLICLAVALSIVVVSEIRKAVVRRRTAPDNPITR